MAKGKRRSITNRNQGNMAATTASPGHPNTPDLDLKSVGFKITGKDAVRGTHEGHK